MQYKYGLIGLATMGDNLARNFANHNIPIAVYNRTTETMTKFITSYGNENLMGFAELAEFVNNLQTPRKIILMVKAGDAVDAVISQLIPLLSNGDIIIDGGNSFYKDTERRYQQLQKEGINFLGMGISGGAEGALNGPSMMPGGDNQTYQLLESDLQQVAANDFNGGKAISYIGKGGAGHFVKMVHNGIEYAHMQAIAEVYDVLHTACRKTNAEIANIFAEWNEGELQSFLLEISIKILRTKDGVNDLVDLITDTAENKGTGKWTLESAVDLGTAVPSIAAALLARYVSANPNRSTYAQIPDYQYDIQNIKIDSDDLKAMLLASNLLSFQQGLELIKTASVTYDWNIDLAEVCRIWQGGCIIRTRSLQSLQSIYKSGQDLFASDYFSENLGSAKQLYAKLAAIISAGVPTPVLSASYSYLLSLTRTNLPTNLIQAQRDFFGQHTYHRRDKPGTFTGGWTE